MTGRLRASVVCVHNRKVLLVKLKDPVSGVARLFPPGGKIEAGETPESAAVRETLEETGYNVELVPERSRVDEYPFVWAGTQFQCTTHFFAARLAEGLERAQVSSEPIVLGVEWVPVERVELALDYDPNIRNSVVGLIFE